MSDSKFLTPEEVCERYRGGVSAGTLRNWRAMRFGPTFVKVGKAVSIRPANLMREIKRIRYFAVRRSDSSWAQMTNNDDPAGSLSRLLKNDLASETVA